ncbi:MAG: hypothetical protein IPM98_14550 [Lewinellaceae bacterium]|nr:hypothetical protein [Lewinellaceae bacterium]
MKIRILLFVLLALGNTALTAQNASLFEFLTATDAPDLTLSTDISALITNKIMEDYQPATLTTADGKSYSAGVKPRGKFRRRISEIPPLKIKVKKKILQAEGLDTLNELKLVLPTSLDEPGNERVIREYLAYRMYEQVTPYHVRARLINLTLLNTGILHQKKYTVKAILLEDEEETAARLGGTLIERFGLTLDSLQTDQAALMSVFQYMVGNTDWGVSENRNVRLLETAPGVIIPIPFDFDFCGFVDAPYASPVSESGLRNVRERYLMADGLSEEALKKAATTLHEHRQTLTGFCRGKHNSSSVAEHCVKYLDAFFREKI